MRKIFYTLFLSFPFFLSSCEKAFMEESTVDKTPQKNFEYLWNECDKKYAFMSYKHIDWTSVKAKYAAQVSNSMSNDQLFTVLAQMLNELRDGHVNLISSFNISHFDVSLLGPKGIDERVVKEHYLSSNYYTTGPFMHDFVKDHAAIGYIRLKAFTGTVTDNQMNFMLDRYKDTKGIILDLRANGGGAASDIFKILSHFVSTKTLLYHTSIKSGAGLDDFTTAEDCFIEPSKGTLYLKKVIVLTDRGTYSAGSFTSTATKAIDSMVLLGDTTGGGMGMPNGGQLPNGWTYRFSITRTLDINGNNWEDGVPPEIPVQFSTSQAVNGIDNIMERAILEF